jgi:hypothetical protein
MRPVALRFLALLAAPAVALATDPPPQVDLPGITVDGTYTTHHGGYEVSSDFRVDPRMPTVVFPAQALVKGDVLSIEPVRINDDEYLVLQECAQADCALAAVRRVWNHLGSLATEGANGQRILIQHENKYWIWLKRLPLVQAQSAGSFFTSFEGVSPPMVIRPRGDLAQVMRAELEGQEAIPPVPVVSQVHEGNSFVVTFQGGSTVRIRRMHASADAPPDPVTPPAP